MTSIGLRLGGQSLELLPERAVFWRDREVVLVADCHFGKASSFRQHGVAVPEGDTSEDLARLDRVIARTGARQLVVVGDFFHSPHGYGPEVVQALLDWRRRRSELCVALVPGNHDRALHRLPAGLALEIAPEPYELDGLTFIHDPGQAAIHGGESASGERNYVCGHVHPAVRLGDGRVRGMRAPCFWLKAGSTLVLPSFGSFTGHAVITPRDGDRVFALAGAQVVEVPATVLGTRTKLLEN
ncbi:MAG: ligase-associated DNA damage response endonuclease PdeM [Verrucomicrobiales bacterium]